MQCEVIKWNTQMDRQTYRKLNSLQKYDIAQNYRIVQSDSAFVPIKPQNFASMPYVKILSSIIIFK
jgi:hypothetical protein